MAPDQRGGPSRRDVVAYGGALVGSGLLAGCSETGGSDSDPATESERTTTATEAETGHTATLAPVGEVTFESVPEDVFTILTHHADMALALGRGDALTAMHAPGYYQSLWRKFTHRLDGVTVDWEGLYSSWPPSKEKLYELDSDVHLADPAKVATAEGWDPESVREIAENVAPWFGNTLSDTHQEPPVAYAENYRYYTLWEIFERVADVFQETERYEGLAAVRESMQATIDERLPPASERPSAALVLFSTTDDSMWGYRLNQPGYYAAHTRPLGATDALASVTDDGHDDGSGNLEIDYETLLAADPDVLLVLGAMSDGQDVGEIRADLEAHDVASAITAVEEGRVVAQGTRNQGPLVNLFQLEMTAKQLYPEQFGDWPGYDDGEPYPAIPADEQLFDRDEVARIVADGAAAD